MCSSTSAARRNRRAGNRRTTEGSRPRRLARHYHLHCRSSLLALLNDDVPIARQVGQLLHLSRWPANDQPVHLASFAESEVNDIRHLRTEAIVRELLANQRLAVDAGHQTGANPQAVALRATE